MSARSQVMSAEQPTGRRGGAVLAADRQAAPVYQDDSARRLRLTLVEGELEGAALRVLARAEQRFGAHIRVAATIIGSSHVIRYAVGACVWHEVFACVPLDAGKQRLYTAPVAKLTKPVELTPDAQTRYTFSATLTDWSAGAAALRRLERQVKSGDGLRLVYQFPTTPHLNDPPQTIVSARLAAPQSVVIVETAHSYPNEGAIVLTRADTYRAAVGESL